MSLLDCLSLLRDVLLREVKPVMLMFGQALHLYLRLSYRPLLEMLSCTLLPALLPAIWETLLNLIILGQCLIQK